MSVERRRDGDAFWRRAQQLFDELIEKSAEDRATALEGYSERDPTLGEAVRELLERDAEGSSFLSRGLESSPLFEPRLVAGQRLGDYRLLEEIGRGGHGVVFKAQRLGVDFEQLVAIKVLRGFLSEASVERALQERRILAGLDHPHIAGLIDGGQTQDGLPYVVMELAEGESITDHCDRLGLSIRARLELFRTVCETVEYAHRSLVVHRDIKPSNVLVSEAGTVKLLDFGIAKLLAGSRLAGDGAQTTQGFVLSPGYASPEQKMGGPITTASDVYSLGVVLHELLTGRRPAFPEGESWAADGWPEPHGMGRLVTGTPHGALEVARRRGHASWRSLGRALAGDLEAIVGQALRADPRRRYPSAERLSAELERYLGGFPVEARRGGWRHRAARYIRRNAVASALAAAVLIVALTAATQTFLQAGRLRRERDAAERAQRQAEAVSELTVDLIGLMDPHGGLRPKPGAQASLDEVYERVLRRFESAPEEQAVFMSEIGEVYRRLALFDESEIVLRGALELRTKLFGERDPRVAQTLQELGHTLASRGDPEGEALLRQALALHREVLGDHHPAVAANLVQLASPLRVRGELDGAERLLREAVAIDGGAQSEESDESLLRLEALALLLAAKQDFAGALQLFGEHGDKASRRYGRQDPRVATALSNQGAAQLALGNFDEAEPLVREALILRREVLEPNHTLIAISNNNLAMILGRYGQQREAAQLYRNAVEIYSDRLEEGHPWTARSLSNLGMVLRDLQQDAEAEPLLRQALALRRAALEPGDLQIRRALHKLAGLLVDQGELDEAEALLAEALSLQREGDPPGLRGGLADTLVNQAELALRRGQMVRAAQLARRGREELGEDRESHRSRRLWTESSLGLALAGQGRAAEAESLLLPAAAQLCRHPGPWTLVFQRAARKASRFLRDQGRGVEARWFEMALEVDLVATVPGATPSEQAELQRDRVCAPLSELGDREFAVISSTP